MLLRGILLQTFLVVVVDAFFMGELEEAVSNFRFDPFSSTWAPTTVSVGSIIQCMADGKPTPIIKWYDTYGDLVSTSSVLNVTENMRHWKQPISLHCLAFNDIWFPKVKGFYTFKVDGAFLSGGDYAGEISFYPPSKVDDPTTVAVGDVIQCMANGIPSPTIKWYDYRWNEVSGCSGLNVTLEMLYWKQPITYHCRAHNELIFPGILGSYTLQVAGAPSSEGDDIKAILTKFSPNSSSKDVAVGTTIQTIRTIWYKTYRNVSGQVQPAIRWYDTKWNELSAWGGLVVTEEMRHWEQPIILHLRCYNGLVFPTATGEGNYQLEVAGAISGGGEKKGLRPLRHHRMAIHSGFPPPRQMAEVHAFVSSSSGTEAWVIAVAVIVPTIVVIAAIAIAVFFIVQRREKKKMSTEKTKPTSVSTAALIFKY